MSTSISGHGARRLSLHSAEMFAERWHKEESEKQNAQSFRREFFIDVCGVSDLREAEIEFERPVINSKRGTTNSIDVFWKNTVLIEHKSAGKDLDVAEQQARGYIKPKSTESQVLSRLFEEYERLLKSKTIFTEAKNDE